MTTAREMLAAAEADAAGIRVAKARRILSVAEVKAAGMLVVARSQGQVLDLDGPVVAVPLDEPTDDQFRRIVASRASSPMRLDGLLASAIASAVDRTFPPNGRTAR